MGNNAAFTAFEATVIAVHNRGILDQALLSELMEPYWGCDIDHGGMRGTLANDGLDIEEIVIKTFGKTIPAPPLLSLRHSDWTPLEEALNDAYQERRYELFHAITDEFGFWLELIDGICNYHRCLPTGNCDLLCSLLIGDVYCFVAIERNRIDFQISKYDNEENSHDDTHFTYFPFDVWCLRWYGTNAHMHVPIHRKWDTGHSHLHECRRHYNDSRQNG
jgi:hypothetical protein